MYVSTLKEVDTAVGFLEYQIHDQLKVEFNLNVEDKDT